MLEQISLCAILICASSGRISNYCNFLLLMVDSNQLQWH